MSEDLWLWAWGAAGAFMLAGVALGTKLFAEPGVDSLADRRRVRLALYNVCLSVLTGAVTAQAFAGIAQEWGSHAIPHLPRFGAALMVGAGSNSLWPKVVRWMGERIEKTKPGATS